MIYHNKILAKMRDADQVYSEDTVVNLFYFGLQLLHALDSISLNHYLFTFFPSHQDDLSNQRPVYRGLSDNFELRIIIAQGSNVFSIKLQDWTDFLSTLRILDSNGFEFGEIKVVPQCRRKHIRGNDSELGQFLGKRDRGFVHLLNY